VPEQGGAGQGALFAQPDLTALPLDLPRPCQPASSLPTLPRLQVHKTKAVVRFMFHNPDDVRWFRPVEVWTKAGRRGRIREPVS